jgi:DNA (cytosine-5)-methyltransferase 1
MTDKITFADIFSGCGGLSYGFYKKRIYQGIVAIDHSHAAGKVFEQNHHKMPFQLRDLYDDEQVKEVTSLLKGKCDVLLGGPPCQGFSTLGKRRDADKRSTLVDVFLNLIRTVKPKIAIIENVRGIKQ